MVSCRNLFGFSIVIILLVLVPFALANPSFSSGPSVNPATNVTTLSSFSCDLTALGTGTITANVSWYKNGVPAGISGSYVVSNAIPTSLLTVTSAFTTKGDSWLCNVLLEDDSTTFGPVNSSSITIVNSPPVLTSPINTVVWYEDDPYLATASATDPDGDSITLWNSIDLNFTPFLFAINPTSGQISFTAQNDSVCGNHTMSIFARDGSTWGGEDVIFDIRPVNDVPVLTTLNMGSHCIENSVCSFTLLASDEENDNVTFYSNESFINLVGATGAFSFTPDFSRTGSTSINITLVDDRGANASYIFTLDVDAINHDPVINYQELSPSTLAQNSPSAIQYTINATDVDVNDTINFTISPDCDLPNPWLGTRVANGSGSTNASFIITKNPVITDNNSFVACRNITVTVFDVDEFGTPKQNIYLDVFMNITNENDYPYIHQYANFTDNGNLFDMHSISTATSLMFYFRVNGSDPDDLTYEGENFYYSIYGGNSSLFTIDSSSGNITSLAPLNTSHIGNLSFFVNITDDEGLSYTETMNITVINNSAPILDTFDNTPCVEDFPCVKTISIYDLDSNLENYSFFSVDIDRPRLNESGSIVHDLRIDYNLSTEDILSKFINFNSFDSSRTNYSINFTPTNNDTGYYVFHLTFVDSFGSVLEDDISFHVFNLNDVPLFDDDADHSTIENLTFPNVVDGVPFEKDIYIYDEDLQYSIDSLNLSFNISSSNFSISDFQLVNLSEDVFRLTFLPNSSHLGNHQINFTVTDLWGGESNFSINFTVVSPGLPPVIDQVRPWSLGGVLQNTLTNPPLSEDINVAEGNTVTFKVTAHDDTPGDIMSVYWYKDGVLVDTYTYGPLETSDIFFDYFDDGIVNVTVEVIDLNFNKDVHTWDVHVSNTNRPPTFVYGLSNLAISNNRSISGPTQYYDFFGLFDFTKMTFFDPDEDYNSNGKLDLFEDSYLTFAPNNGSDCLALANFEFTNENLVIVPTQIGTCYVNFTATDPYGAVAVSNEIRIDILDTQSDYNQQTSGESNTITQTKTITVPFTEEVNVPEEFNLIIPGVTVVYENGTVIIPIRLRNDWDADLKNIQLSANSSYPFQNFIFSQDFFTIIPKGMALDINLTMTNYRADAPFEVNISAYIGSEDFTDTSVVFVNALERGHEDSESLRSRIGFARDLLSDNPECEELNELLNEAEKKIGGNNQEGLDILNAVINSCKYLVNEAKTHESTTPQSFLGKLGFSSNSSFNFPVLFVAIMILFVGALIVGVLSSFKLKKI
ncbi:hypothetical protein JXA48_00320 [Candidatus Woesearchaeota archaeon]|nr:hypothetical protein [Candidatus Woesearchaeota archaeon]